MARYRAGIDIGGTFTDGTLVDTETGQAWTSKVLSTPDDPSRAFLSALIRLLEDTPADAGEIEQLVHATTVATNAIIEGKTAPTAFVTTEGFSDMLEIARQIRPSLYDLQFEKPPPLVPRRLSFGVPERLNARGEVVTPLDEDAVRAIAKRIAASDVEAVAVCLLHSYRNPDHENRVGKILRDALPDRTVSLSSEVAPEFREYLRASTTVINASVRPVVGRYINAIQKRLRDKGIGADLLVMQSSGGVYSAEAAANSPVFMVESGPAAGAVAAAFLGTSLGFNDVISFDMGGTTAKASLIRDGVPSITKDYTVGGTAQRGAGAFGGASGYPVRTPVVDLTEIGAGGGSIAWVDSGGALRVGPRSAGASPGPACYGLGGDEPTITDANLVLGRLDAAAFAGGEMPLDVDAATRAITERCAAPLGLGLEEAANGIIEIANTAMVNTLRLVSVQRGYDPRDFLLIAFGGAGPAHACRLAEEAGIPQLLIPTNPGTASALGLLVTDVRLESTATVIMRIGETTARELRSRHEELKKRGDEEYRHAGLPDIKPESELSVEMRYFGQSFELTVPAPETEIDDTWVGELARRFHSAHKRAYGFSVEDEPVEIVNLRLTTIGRIRKPELPSLERDPASVIDAKTGERRVYFGDGGWAEKTAVFNRSSLLAGAEITGPAIVEERDSTTVIYQGWSAEVDPHGNLLVKNTST